MAHEKNQSRYEIDRQDESQAIVIKHIEDHSNGQALLWGLLSYVLLLPALFAVAAWTPVF